MLPLSIRITDQVRIVTKDLHLTSDDVILLSSSSETLKRSWVVILSFGFYTVQGRLNVSTHDDSFWTIFVLVSEVSVEMN